jgi:opacity protein-like surface antigen
MPRSIYSRAMIGLLAVLVAQSTAVAQRGNPTFNLGGGLSLATGPFGDRNEAGYSLVAGIGMTQRGSPISFRAEGIYNEFNPKSGGDKAKVSGGTANAIYDVSTSSGSFTPYAIGGIGYFSTKEPRLFGTSSRTNVGWNLGGGLKFPLTGFSAYFEARYHKVADVGISVVPIVFGLLF